MSRAVCAKDGTEVEHRLVRIGAIGVERGPAPVACQEGWPSRGRPTHSAERDVILDLGLSSCSPPKSIDAGEKQRDVVALCCRDGIAAITAALRMRNAREEAQVYGKNRNA